MSTRYELHYRTILGSVIFCGDFADYTDAVIERDILQDEFPEHEYWIDSYESHRED